jgi:hypothetical protein
MVQVAGGGVHRVAVSVPSGQIINDVQIDAEATSGHAQNGWTLLATAHGLIVTGANGVSQTLAGIPAAVNFAPVSTEWVQIQSQSSTAAWLLHLDAKALADPKLSASEIPMPRRRPRRVPV